MTPETIGHIVTQGGVPCTLYNASMSRIGGVLIPGEPVVFFTKSRDARRAIERTRRVGDALKGSMVDDWIRLSPLQSGRPYDIMPVMRSHVAAKTGQGQQEGAAS
jgi:hypothetical protein